MAENNLVYTVLIVLIAVLILNPGFTGNFNYKIASSYGPSEVDQIVTPTESGKVIVVPSFREGLGDGSIIADVEACIGDKKVGSEGRISTLTEASDSAVSIADTACYLECVRYGGSISPLFKHSQLESVYIHTCAKIRTQCYCTI